MSAYKGSGKVVNATARQTGARERKKESFLPVYETDLPAKSDHFFTNASLMMSPLLSTTMAAEKDGR